MGGHPWFYFVEYQPDINSALQSLRHREFDAGRYNPVIWFPDFPVDHDSPSPGPQHDSIEEAIEDSDADGTRSILDMERVSGSPDFCAVSPLSEDVLLSLFGTVKPTHEMVETNYELYELIERGHGIYVIVYEGELPSEIFFAGYSFD